jgi:hypothetical protein
MLHFDRLRCVAVLSEKPIEELYTGPMGLKRHTGKMQNQTTKLYKTLPTSDRIQRVQELCEQMWGTCTAWLPINCSISLNTNIPKSLEIAE